jgi:Ca2+-binding RTX toxin-like protein
LPHELLQKKESFDMHTKVTWGSAANEMGFAQPQNIFNLFNQVIGNDSFPITASSTNGFTLEGTTAFGGFNLDLCLTISGTNMIYDSFGDPTGGTITRIKLDQKTDSGGFQKIFALTNMDLPIADLVEALGFEERGGFDGTVEALLYGTGWTYIGTPSADVIDPGQNFFGFGTSFAMTGSDRINTGRDHDLIHSLEGNDTISSGGGQDTINGGQGRDIIKGGRGNDSIRGDDDYWNGARDRIFGGAGRDTIEAGPGNDTINGGRGNDVMWDQVGRDTFVFTGRSGNDLINDVDNNGMNLDIRTNSNITVSFLNVEGAYSQNGFDLDYFDRGYLVEWGENSVLIQTYAEISHFNFSDDFTFLS